MAWWTMIAGKAVGEAVGGALGKVLGKAAEWVPNPEQYRRNKKLKLEKEQDELKKQPYSPKRDARLLIISGELSKITSEAFNK